MRRDTAILIGPSLARRLSRLPGRLAARLHADERGNLGILLLLTIWALVALIGLVWNSGEYATRRKQVQAAADSTAHAGNLWVGRTLNLTASANLVMAENGSAEVILRAVAPTKETIQKRFNAEHKRAVQLGDGDSPADPESSIPDCEYFEELLGFGAWQAKGRGDVRLEELGALTTDVTAALRRIWPLLTPAEQARLGAQIPESLRRNDVALRWLVRVWISGAAPSGAGQPAAPGGGLMPQYDAWITQQVRPRLTDIISTIEVQQSWLDRFTQQTAPALAAATPEQLREARFEIFDYESRIRGLTPDVVEEQRQAMADFYECDVTLSTPGRRAPPGEPAAVSPPLQPAADVPGEPRTDSIRVRYASHPRIVSGEFPITFTVDPINVNEDEAAIWHPGFAPDLPPGIVPPLNKQQFTGSFGVSGGKWGRVPCAPLNRFFNDRVHRDRQGLRQEPRAIDRTRSELRGRIHPPPPPGDVPDLPRQTPDEQPGAGDIPIPPENIPRLPTPDALTAADKAAIDALNERIRQFNRDLNRYVAEIRNLQNSLDRMDRNLTALTDYASTEFADNTWLGYVELNRRLVLRLMGNDKHFMVLDTYQLRRIPGWARQEMRDDVQRYAENEVYRDNIERVTRSARDRIYRWAFPILNGQLAEQRGGNANSAAQRARQLARQFADQHAPRAAEYAVRQAARQISQEVAQEWIERPWPFEIAPPEQSEPPHQGLTDEDRRGHFTFLAAARTNEESMPRPFLAKIFVPTGRPMAATAQGEAFNWMEFNEPFGASDRCDRITHYGHGDMGGSPRPWRISSTGGWNWQPRLSLADAIDQAVEDGPQFREFLEQAGVSSYDADAIRQLTRH